MTPEPGLLVTSNLRLLRLLGRGGMGAVWVAEHLTLGTEVAVKFIAGVPGELDPKHVQRFRREARAAAKLRSPHVVRTYDHGVMEGGLPYIVMELLEGETLAARLQREGHLDPRVTALVVAQTAKALSEAHAHGIVHRDIKPSNLFLAQSGGELLVKVLDFGIAKLADPETGTTKTGSLMGTLHYMSPEQLNDSSSVGPSADLWSLSVVAYHALTGTLPFEGATPVALWRAITAQSFSPPSSTRELPAAVDAFFEQALREDAGDRFPDAPRLAAAFAEAVDAISLLPVSSGEVDVPPSAGTVKRMGEMPTAEYVEQAALEVTSDDKPEAPTPEADEGRASDDEDEAPTDTADTFVSPEASPPSAVKRRRSMAMGFGLGAGTLALAVVVIWATGYLRPPPPPPSSVSKRGGHRPATTVTARPAAAPSAPSVPAAGATSSAGPHPSATGPAANSRLYPIGCEKDDRPCGQGCCIWDRGCEPYACDQPLPDDDAFRVTLTKVIAWPEGKPRDIHFFRDAEVFIRFGLKGHKRQLVTEGLVIKGADLRKSFAMWIQVNDDKLPERVIDLRPTGVSPEYVKGRMLCRGIQTRIPRRDVVYSVWLAVRPADAPAAKLCNKAVNPM